MSSEEREEPEEPVDEVAERLKAAADVLESVVCDRSLLRVLSLEERTRLRRYATLANASSSAS